MRLQSFFAHAHSMHASHSLIFAIEEISEKPNTDTGARLTRFPKIAAFESYSNCDLALVVIFDLAALKSATVT